MSKIKPIQHALPSIEPKSTTKVTNQAPNTIFAADQSISKNDKPKQQGHLNVPGESIWIEEDETPL